MTSPLSGNAHPPRILPLPLRKVMQEQEEAGGTWIEKDTGRHKKGDSHPLMKRKGDSPRAVPLRRAETDAGLGREALDEKSVVTLTHEPHPQQKSSL